VTVTEANTLTGRIRGIALEGQITLPPLPEIGAKLLGLLEQDSRASPGSVAELIRLEPAIAATILKTANSAAFGGLQAITDLTHAIPRLGVAQVSSIVTALVHKGHFDHSSSDKQALLRVLWDHAVATAITARHISGMCGGDPEQAFLAGLLHDVGKLLVLKGVDFLEESPETVNITPSVLAELMTDLHAELGQRVLMEWNLPEPITQVALRHHEEQPGTEEALLIRVQAANAIARSVAAHPDPQPDLRLSEVAAVEQLGLSDVELGALLVDLEDELGEAKQLL